MIKFLKGFITGIVIIVTILTLYVFIQSIAKFLMPIDIVYLIIVSLVFSISIGIIHMNE